MVKETHLDIVDEDHHDRLPPHLLDRIQIPQRIHLVEPPIAPHTRTCPAIPNIIPLPRNLPPPLLPPPLQKLIILFEALLLLLPPPHLATIYPARLPTLLSTLHPPPPHLPPRLLKAARIRNHPLHARRPAAVEARRREVEPPARSSAGQPHLLLDSALLVPALLVLLVLGLRRVLGVVERRAGRTRRLVDHRLELLLGRCSRCHLSGGGMDVVVVCVRCFIRARVCSSLSMYARLIKWRGGMRMWKKQRALPTYDSQSSDQIARPLSRTPA